MGASNWPGLALPKPPPRNRAKAKKVKDRDTHEERVYRTVDQRDKHRCKLTGRKGNPYSVDPLDRLHHNHIVMRSQGGPTETWNICLVHRIVHDLLTENRIDVRGNADESLVWTVKEDAVVEAFGSKRVPVGVRVVANEDWEAFMRTVAREKA